MTIYKQGIAEAVGVSDPHGAAQHTDVTRELWLPANEGFVSTGTPTVLNNYPSVSGGANADEPRVYLSLKVPDDFVSFTSVKALWICGVGGQDMYWQILGRYAASGESRVEHADEPVLGVTVNGGASVMNVQEPANPLTLVNLAAGDYLGLKFNRIGSDALDTLDVGMYFLGLLFTYTANQ